MVFLPIKQVFHFCRSRLQVVIWGVPGGRDRRLLRLVGGGGCLCLGFIRMVTRPTA